ncbi:class I SAM-dependent rRNA methyltransferase [Echinicola jeungdonensis]|uniref:Class I SAM-dependent rRNA methyltransferase n=1 Tax=Echinicola jeungdonensis TaxID=709343 RepID=A0ABV5J7Y6_9BACT|nr:class I SAM-dependent rRNA methyltransferase [Echinicola jeungdonensis]MDN3670755.1 class I SAM-dependent rRNA methyltransferase [Echinicola jeungdonensis]
MSNHPNIILKKGKEISLKRHHHWVFSGAIAEKDGNIPNGQLVTVWSQQKGFLGIGHYQNGSIAVRIISFENREIDQAFWKEKIQNAFNMRQSLGLTNNKSSNVYRLVHGEGDLLPGLIIDFYNGTTVIQAHNIGIHQHLDEVSNALQEIYGTDLQAVYDKSAETLPKNQIETENRFLFGHPKTNMVLENDCQYEIDWEKGQKTGFFIDQRENRKLLGDYSLGKKVLNTFCYSGGFSVSALKAGAKEVHSVDISAKAIELTHQNVALNPDHLGHHEAKTADVIKYIREIKTDYDIIVLDPPAFAKNIKARHNAVQAYKRLNAAAFKQIKPGGLLFTFSCSQVVDKRLFANTITAAALESGRNIKILHYLSQPADHPVNIYHPETEYLKGLVLYVE